MSSVALDMTSTSYCIRAETLSGWILSWLFYLSLKTQSKEGF